MKQTYEQRVQALAEKMAPQYFNNQNYPHTWDGGTLNDTHKHYWIGKCTPFARIAVAEMGAVAERAYMIGRSYNNPYDRAGLAVTLKDLGLIPDNRQDLAPPEPDR